MSIRDSIIRKIFNKNGLNTYDYGNVLPLPAPVQNSNIEDKGRVIEESKILSEELATVLERLSELPVNSFNVSELAFTGQPLEVAPTAHTVESFLALLVPHLPPTIRFTSLVRSLQFLVAEATYVITEAETMDPGLADRARGTVTNIEAQVNRLLRAAWNAHISHATYSLSADTTGSRVYLFPIMSTYPMIEPVPLVTAVVFLISTIHCFMNISQSNCGMILKVIRALLRIAIHLQDTRERFYFDDIVDRIPDTLETVLSYLGIHSNLVFYTVCPKCSTLYTESLPVPDRCGALNQEGAICQAALKKERHRGKSTWSRPRRRYSHLPFEVWLSNFLMRPGIEDLIENKRPEFEEECTDFWGASFLNEFPGQGQRSFFDTTTENLRLAFLIYHDFFNPFKNKAGAKQNSVGLVLMVCLNLPHQIRYNRENVYVAAVIPGPSVPRGDQINHFIRPIAKNMLEHYSPGVWIARTHKYPNGRHIRSAALVESMDSSAARSWAGLGSVSHTILCSSCYIPQDCIDEFDVSFPSRSMPTHIKHVNLWQSASNKAERNALWKKYAARHSEWLCFPFLNPFISSTIGPMHWYRNILEKQLRENMDWSWVKPNGIPTAPKSARSITQLELEWGRMALQYCTRLQLEKTGLTEGLLRYLCNERNIFNAGLPAKRMLKDLDTWRQRVHIINSSGVLINPLPNDWGLYNREGVAKAHFYLSKTSNAEFLVRKSHVANLRYLCQTFGLEVQGSHLQLSHRLIEHYRPTRGDRTEVPTPTGNCDVSVLGVETMTEIQMDMEETIIPGWLKPPPKNFGTISHGKIGAEEYKSLAMVSMTISLVRIWHNAGDAYIQRLNNFLHLMLAVRVLALQSISKHNIGEFTYHYGRYLRDVKQLYPHCTVVPTQHLGLHIPKFLEKFGPATRFNENPCEMFIGMLQEVPTNWKIGELEYTFHKEFALAANLEARLIEPEVRKALGEVGELIQGYLDTRHPGNSAHFANGWEFTHPSTTSILSKEIRILLADFCRTRQIESPTREQFICSKMTHGHVIYQPEANAVGNSQILFDVPGTLTRAAGRIESVCLQTEGTGSRQQQAILLVCPFKPLNTVDDPLDIYSSHPLIGARGARIAAMFYETADPALPIIIQPKDIVAHIATCRYRDNSRRFSEPCIVAISLDLKHARSE